MSTLHVDIEGLDLVLGGGFSLLERVPGAGESATILIRGPAGSGKTVLGTRFAASIAQALKTDVAYGCVELLPVELRAQHESIRVESAKEKVVLLHEDAASDPDQEYVRVYAGLMDLGGEGEAVARLGEAVDALLSAATTRAHRKVRVLVVDSLSEGYGLGSTAPRALADGISKFAAEQGLVVILLEEQSHEGSSMWTFAVDSVFELKAAEEGTPFERRVLIPKNRLGPSDPGPHEFSVRSRLGVVIYPRIAAYLKPWRYEALPKWREPVSISHPWSTSGLDEVGWLPPFRQATTAVVGADFSAVSRLASWLGSEMRVQASVGFEIKVALGGPYLSEEVKDSEADTSVVLAWGPLQSGSSILADLRRTIERQIDRARIPIRVVVGDLRGMAHYPHPGEAVQTVSAIASLMRDMKIPLILYETSDESHDVLMSAVSPDVVFDRVGEPALIRGLRNALDVRVSTQAKSEERTIQLYS